MQTSPLGRIFSSLLMILIGCAFAAGGWFFVLGPELRVMKEFQQTPCTVTDKRLVKNESGTGKDRKTSYRPEFHIRYTVNGATYDADTYDIARVSGGRHWSQETLDRFEVGREYPCWYDPADPKTSVLHVGTTSLGWILLTVGGLVGLIGIGALVWFVVQTLLGTGSAHETNNMAAFGPTP